jgi:hypothetical protein
MELGVENTEETEEERRESQRRGRLRRHADRVNNRVERGILLILVILYFVGFIRAGNQDQNIKDTARDAKKVSTDLSKFASEQQAGRRTAIFELCQAINTNRVLLRKRGEKIEDQDCSSLVQRSKGNEEVGG